jgi:hypothetical protein
MVRLTKKLQPQALATRLFWLGTNLLTRETLCKTGTALSPNPLMTSYTKVHGKLSPLRRSLVSWSACSHAR